MSFHKYLPIPLVLLALMLAGTGLVSADEGKETQFSVSDFRNKIISFKQPARRIVCLIESALSGLYMLGAEENIIAVSRNVYDHPLFDYYSQLDNRIKNHELPAPGNWDFVSIESVVALKPDLVILWSSQTEAIAALEQRGIKVYGIFIEKQADVLREIESLGKITGHDARALELHEFAKAQVSDLEHRLKTISTEEKPLTYFMWSQGKLDTSCDGSTVQDLINLAGGRNVCASIKGEHLTINIEQLLTWNPALIVMWDSEKLKARDILEDEQLRTIKAIREKRVYQLKDPFIADFWTLKYLYAARLLAAWLHPELFDQATVEQEKARFLQALYNRDSIKVLQ